MLEIEQVLGVFKEAQAQRFIGETTVAPVFDTLFKPSDRIAGTEEHAVLHEGVGSFHKFFGKRHVADIEVSIRNKVKVRADSG